MRREKVLVTGGAGYIGSVLVPCLLAKDYDVTVLDNFMFEQSSLLECCHYINLRIIRGDVRDFNLLMREVWHADWIIPLACLTGGPLCNKNPWAARATILEAIKTINSACNDQQKIIYPTTNSGYGIGQENIECTEETPLMPISLYGQLKVAAEKLILDRGNSVTLRLATVFGTSPRMRLDLLVNDFVYRAVTDKFIVLFEAHFKRNYIHIRDVVRAFLHVMDNFESMVGQPYNVGLSDANLSKFELCEEIKKQLPDFFFHCAEVGKDPDQRNYIVSNTKIEKTGFKPRHSLQEGISELIKAYQIIRRNQFSNI